MTPAKVDLPKNQLEPSNGGVNGPVFEVPGRKFTEEYFWKHEQLNN